MPLIVKRDEVKDAMEVVDWEPLVPTFREAKPPNAVLDAAVLDATIDDGADGPLPTIGTSRKHPLRRLGVVLGNGNQTLDVHDVVNAPSPEVIDDVPVVGQRTCHNKRPFRRNGGFGQRGLIHDLASYGPDGIAWLELNRNCAFQVVPFLRAEGVLPQSARGGVVDDTLGLEHLGDPLREFDVVGGRLGGHRVHGQDALPQAIDEEGRVPDGVAVCGIVGELEQREPRRPVVVRASSALRKK